VPRFDVDRLEFVILVERAGLTRIPMVASYSNYGTPFQDIPRELEAAEQRCRDRGLIRFGGKVVDELQELLSIYSRTSVEYDLRFSAKKGTELRAAVCRSGDSAVRTVVDGDRVLLDPVRPSDLIPAIVGVLPQHPPAKIRPPINVDLAEMRAAMADVRRRGVEDDRAIEEAVRARGVNVSAFRRVNQLLSGPRLGLGELGVTIWDERGKEHRGEQTIRIIDLPAGRTAVYNSGTQRMFAGADLGTFNRVLSELTKQTQRQAAWEYQY
jgi:hypothetical protein